RSSVGRGASDNRVNRVRAMMGRRDCICAAVFAFLAGPRHQLVDPTDRVTLSDLRECISEISLRIELVHLAVCTIVYIAAARSPPLSAPSEEKILPPKGHAAKFYAGSQRVQPLRRRPHVYQSCQQERTPACRQRQSTPRL